MEHINKEVICMDADQGSDDAPREPAIAAPPFLNRHEAGRALARVLRPYELDSDIVVIALPSGGVPIAYAVARALHAPLGVCVVRKLGVPGHPDLAMGAIASGDICVMNPGILEQFRITREVFDQVAQIQAAELRRREFACRIGLPSIPIAGRTVIVVDDGVATGASMRAATASMRQQGVERIMLATPLCAQSICRALSAQADRIYCLRRPESARPISESYEQFPLVTDDDVRHLLRRAAAIPLHT